VYRHLSHPLAVVLSLAALPLAHRPVAAAADEWQLLGRNQVSFAAEKDIIPRGCSSASVRAAGRSTCRGRGG